MSSVWQWEDDDGWKDYGDQDAALLEQAYQAGSASQLVCNGYAPFLSYDDLLLFTSCLA